MKSLIDIKETINQLHVLEQNYQSEVVALRTKIETLKLQLLGELNLFSGDKVTFIMHEHRDDRVHCFAIAQTAELFIKDVSYSKDENGELFLYPVMLKKAKAVKPVYFNKFLSWTLKKGDQVILEHKAEQIIIPDTYKGRDIEELKARLLNAQKLS